MYYDTPEVGSSPLARGLRTRRPRGRPTGRIIPARAGFTVQRAGGRGPRPDHPRSRGVYVGSGVPRGGWNGSSPLARGLRDRDLPQGGPDRIIPARAGFTPRSGRCGAWASDHPRSRGVYSAATSAAAAAPGSSPLARGLQVLPRPRCGFRRIIPARAGFTLHQGHRPRARRDHPRSRGVYPVRPASRSVASGSSPLARGLPRPVSAPMIGIRIIPARAGFTP